ISSLSGQLMLAEEERSAAFELRQKGISIDFVGEKMLACDRKIVELNSSLEELRNQLRLSAEAINRYYESKDQLQQLISRVRHREGRDVYKQRSLVAARLRSLIQEIQVCATQSRYFSGGQAD